jgi:hypothetical protein
VRYGLLYLVVSLVLLWPVLLGYVPLSVEIATNTPLWGSLRDGIITRQYGVMEDQVVQFYPWHRLIGEAIRSGTIPLWNPYSLGGYPMHAAFATAIFAPLTMLAWVLPIDLAWTLAFVLRPVLAALGTALFARALGLGHAAALSAGVVFAWCGFQVGWAGQAMPDVAIWVPWTMLGVLRVAERQTPARIGLAAVPFALAPLSGHPEVAAYVVLAGAAYALTWVIWPRVACSGPVSSGRRWLARGKTTAGLAAAAALSGLLCAIQVLPTIEWLPQLDRQLVSSSSPMPGFYVANLILRQTATEPFNVVGAYIPNGAMYAGLVSLVLLPAALLHPRRREVWFCLGMLLVALQFTFGWGPLFWLHQASPVPIDFPKTRIIMLAELSLAMLAGFGVAALSPGSTPGSAALDSPGAAPVRGAVANSEMNGTPGRGRSGPKRIDCRALSVWLAGAVALVAVAIGAVLLALPDPGPTIDPSRDPFSWPRFIFQGTPFALALLILTVVAVAVPLFWKRVLPHRGSVLGGLVALDMLTFAYGNIPFAHTETLLTVPPAIRFLQEHADASWRVMAARQVIPYNWEAQWRLAAPSGYAYVTRPMIDVSTSLMPERDPGVVELYPERMFQSRTRLLDLLAVRYLVTSSQNGSTRQFEGRPERFTRVYDDGPVQIFENRGAVPRAQLIPCEGVRVVPFQRRTVVQVSNSTFDPATMAILDDKVDCPEVDGAPASSPVTVLEATFNSYGVQAEVAVPSLLVYSDLYYEGWRAFVDGAEVPVLRADHAFKAVRVDPGSHHVRFVFDPPSFRRGLMLTILGLVILAGLLGWSALRHRKQPAA